MEHALGNLWYQWCTWKEYVYHKHSHWMMESFPTWISLFGWLERVRYFGDIKNIDAIIWQRVKKFTNWRFECADASCWMTEKSIWRQRESENVYSTAVSWIVYVRTFFFFVHSCMCDAWHFVESSQTWHVQSPHIWVCLLTILEQRAYI